MQIEILINSKSYQTWESFFRPLFRLVTQRREAQKRPWRRSHASLTSDLEHSKIFVSFFSYVHVFCEMPLNEKQAAYWKSRKFIPFCFSNFWSSSNHKWRRQQQWHLTKGFKLHARFHFFAHLFAFVCKKKNLIIRSSRFWEHKHLAE